MDNGLTALIIALACGAAAYFAVSYILTKLSYNKMSKSRLQMAYMAIEEAEKGSGPSIQERLASRLVIAGWYGGLAPIVTATGFLYAACVLAMYLVGFNQVLGIFVAVPACAGVVSVIVMRISARRQLAFQRQLMSALGMLAAQIEAGNGAERALEQILPSLEDPLGAELHGALASTVTVELVTALQEVSKRYPSRAFTLFLAALEVDRLQGGALAPALREASSMLQRQFELSQEAQAEVSQAKVEFYTVGGIVLMIAATLLTAKDEAIRGAYFSPVGMVGLGFGFALAGFGVIRAMRVLRQAKGGEA
jgi:Flp pilus assembly protein TadB